MNEQQTHASWRTPLLDPLPASEQSLYRDSIVIPVYNERAGLRHLLAEMEGVIDHTTEVIVVDDGSKDGSAEIAAAFSFCRTIKHPENRGKGAALRTGFSNARGENIIWIDADGTYPTAKVQEISAALRNGYDVVYGSRRTGRENMPLINRFGNRALSFLVRRLYGFKPRDALTGLCGVKKAHLERMQLTTGHFGIESEIAAKASRMGLSQLDLPITYQPRIGQAKLRGLHDGLKIGLTILRFIRWHPPQQSSVFADSRANGYSNGYLNGAHALANGAGNGHAGAIATPINDHAHHTVRHFASTATTTRPKVTALVCTLNEERNLPLVLPKLPPSIDELLIVDGHSSDRTVEVISALRPDARILLQEGKGKGAALRQGIQRATGDIIVFIDADGSMDPNDIDVYVGKLLQGYDVAKGSRFLPGGGSDDFSRLRRFGNKAFTFMVNVLFQAHSTDLCYGYLAGWRTALTGLDLRSTGFEIETEINVRLAKNRLKVAEVPSFEASRVYGDSNLHSFRDGVRILSTILRERLIRWS
jgi:glycosyltransferase involved in cell wall biosynthesis